MALAMLAVPAVASANVAYDDASVGSVSEGDVMTLFGWNEAKFQSTVKTDGGVTFTSKKVAKFDWSWKCSDGNTYHWIYTSTTAQPVNAAKVFNASANKVTGFTLNGVTGTPTTTSETTGPQMFTCPDGGMGTARRQHYQRRAGQRRRPAGHPGRASGRLIRTTSSPSRTTRGGLFSCPPGPGSCSYEAQAVVRCRKS